MPNISSSGYFRFLAVCYLLAPSFWADRRTNNYASTRSGPRLQYSCESGGTMTVVNPDPDLFEHAFITLESGTELLETKWAENHETLTIFLPSQVVYQMYNVLVRFSVRPDVVIGNNGLVYRITCSGYTASQNSTVKLSAEGLQSVESLVRQGDIDGKPVTVGVVREEDLFWTIQTFENHTMKPLNCTISAGEAPYYSESSTIIINGCSTDHWIMDDFTRLTNYRNYSSLYYTRLHTFRFYSHTYLTVLCKLRVCPSALSQVCHIECNKLKRYYANEPGQPEDVMYTHIEFTLLIEYSHNRASTKIAVRTMGDYKHYHYGCDGLDDRGWGCGYRTLQSLCSWTKETLGTTTPDVPGIPQIQEALVAMGDKEPKFVGSKEWIGSVEVGLCLDYFYNVPCKIEHVSCGSKLGAHLPVIEKHFQDFGSPIMMGGDSDSSSKGIVGVCIDNPGLLVVDPHHYSKPGEVITKEDLQANGFIHWKLVEEFDQHSFYNLCLPQLRGRSL